MIVVKQLITIEYETEDKRKKHIEEMKEEGFTIERIWSSIDTNARNHIWAEYLMRQKGYLGKSIYEQSSHIKGGNNDE